MFQFFNITTNHFDFKNILNWIFTCLLWILFIFEQNIPFILLLNYHKLLIVSQIPTLCINSIYHINLLNLTQLPRVISKMNFHTLLRQGCCKIIGMEIHWTYRLIIVWSLHYVRCLLFMVRLCVFFSLFDIIIYFIYSTLSYILFGGPIDWASNIIIYMDIQSFGPSNIYNQAWSFEVARHAPTGGALGLLGTIFFSFPVDRKEIGK